MDWPALLKTICLCLISIIIEAFSASKAGKKWFENFPAQWDPKLGIHVT